VVTLSKRQWNGTRGLESIEAMTHGQLAMWLGQLVNT
jgi:hypothetical protein